MLLLVIQSLENNIGTCRENLNVKDGKIHITKEFDSFKIIN